ncbi:uncharacterized protein LOC112506998 isoform X2 [Cynara cardunculus var. scolymus]|uniref:uncharacterized protein LOC112506998 isoform X2 n=1 Tax=Cynara cardunculus var. scolymus TaxID=59895 RepID=UPI000D625C06|nr:uncharacterized protein LOC112506998 isoform X2 [Cynara cardunculus var. scolymus]
MRMEALQQRVESWIRDQRTKLLKVTWPQQWPVAMKWPWIKGREQRKRMNEEYQRRKKQLHNLCIAVKADSLSDLQDILCCMVLSECVYKRPDAEVVQAVNKFKADFDGQVVSLERIQPSSDHVPHRYLLAETGDTLFASFIGTKQYKDMMADANILQGAIFHDDAIEDTDEILTVEGQKKTSDDAPKTLGAKPQQGVTSTKPAAHRGFMSRAKGIPALELYKLAQKKKRKLVLCGHSLGGAVAVLSTLAILRVIAAASSSKEHEKVHVKCITFSQPPVGNAALRDYVSEKGWQQYFKTYCIPEDLVPRILSPAYFHHYNAHPYSPPIDAKKSSLSTSKQDIISERQKTKVKENEREQLVLGLGPVHNSFWRLSKLVPIDAVRRQLNKYTGNKFGSSVNSAADSNVTSSIEDTEDAPQSLEIEEDSDGISLKPFPTADKGDPGETINGNLSGKSKLSDKPKVWHRVPALPSYVPFGQLYLLGNSSVESLSGAEYSKLTSVKSVIAELRERLQSHSMRSYRSRFQRIYNDCMRDSSSSFLGMDQQQQFPQLQKWLGISLANTVELGHIVESPIICTATSVVPLGWNGVPGEKNVERIKVDITGIGLHLCTLVQARVNGNWCSTTVEAFPSGATNHLDHGVESDIQKIRVLVGRPLRRPPKHQITTDSLISAFPSIDLNPVDQSRSQNLQAFNLGKFICPEGLSDFFIFCTTDFSTISKEVHVRTRRVRLVGLEGAGKTSLLKAILDEGRVNVSTNVENFPMDVDVQEGTAGGLCFTDSAGVNLQDLNKEAARFKDELWMGSNASTRQPALSFLLDEAKALGIPWVLAITNKFSVSAHQQKPAVEAVLQAYQATPSTTEVINSCPYVMPSAANIFASVGEGSTDNDASTGPHKLIAAPINLLRRSFQKKSTILPVEGVGALCQLVHRVLRNHEEVALQELAKDRLMVELAKERESAVDASQDAMAKANSMTAAAVGASVGAGVGLVMAIVMGAASALRKP